MTGSAPPSSAALERAPCLLCGAPPPEPAYSFPPFGVVRCPSCGLWYLSPRLNEAEMLDAYREVTYFEGSEGPGYSSYLAQEPTLRRTFRRLLRTMKRRGMTGGRLLEVGCAYGFFLDEAKPYFDYRAGTEFSEAGAALARTRSDAVYLGGLEAIPDLGPADLFDGIALIHTIEHIYDPVALLRGLLSHLAPGGFLLLATPDMGGFWRPLLGRRWPFFKAPEHVAYYSAETLAALLTAAGCAEIEPVPYVSYFPLSLVGEKIAPPAAASDAQGTSAPSWWRRLAIWMPATTVAVAGRSPRRASGGGGGGGGGGG
ncbi:MAG: class I SAM-dependent methyltransferase [Thermoanaerobaculia bacterium]